MKHGKELYHICYSHPREREEIMNETNEITLATDFSKIDEIWQVIQSRKSLNSMQVKKKSTPNHIRVKQLKTKDKNKSIKAARRKDAPSSSMEQQSYKEDTHNQVHFLKKINWYYLLHVQNKGEETNGHVKQQSLTFWHQEPVLRKMIFPRTRGGIVQVVMQAMGSDGEWQIKLHSLAHHSPPAVRPGS